LGAKVYVIYYSHKGQKLERFEMKLLLKDSKSEE